MVSLLAPLSSVEGVVVATRQRLQASVSWRELAAAIRDDSYRLRRQALHLRRQSRHVRAQRASLWAESMVLCPTRESPG